MYIIVAEGVGKSLQKSHRMSISFSWKMILNLLINMEMI